MKNKTPNDEDYSAYMGVGHNQPKDMLEIAKLANAQYEKSCEIEKLEDALEKAKEEFRKLAEEKLPPKMEELGIQEYTTTEGIHVKVKEEIRGGLPEEKRAQGFKWLEDKGHEALIKSEVVVAFPRKELDKAKKLVEDLRKDDFIVSLERSVHFQTMQAFIKEQMLEGKDIPLDIFKVFRQRVAKVEKE